MNLLIKIRNVGSHLNILKFSGTFEVSIQNNIIKGGNSPKYENREKINKK